MFRYLVVVTIAIVLVACGSHSDAGDPLAGTWGVKDGGTVKPLLKIEKNGEQYVVSNFAHDNWTLLKEPIKSMTTEDLAKVSGNKESSSVVGIQANTFAFFHVPAGWGVPGFSTQTGYVLFVPIKLIDLQRISS